MDDATGRRLTLGFLSGWISRGAGALIQLVQVPLFLHFWTPELYGEWLILSSIPTYLSFSNIGFGAVASNEMTMHMARDERSDALRVFQSCWWLVAIVCAITMALFGAALYFLPVSRWLPVQTLSLTDTRWILFALGTAVLFGQLEQLLGAVYTCVGRYPYGSFIKSVITLCAFAAMTVPVLLGRGPRTTAIVFGAANILGTIVLGVMVRRDVPWIAFGWRYARWSEIRRLTRPAFAFMGMPIGNALNLQGTLMAVGYTLGPQDVAAFGTARTISRVALQMIYLVNQTFWPELSAAFGAGNMQMVRTMHRRAVQASLLIGVVLTLATVVLGSYFLPVWTRHKLPPSPGLLLMLMISVVLCAGWTASSTLLMAINRHQKLAAYYVIGTGLTVIATYVSAKYYGLLAAAASLILSELIMNIYVLPATLRISDDHWGAFLRSFTHYPQSLRPAALWRRLRRSTPVPADTPEIDF